MLHHKDIQGIVLNAYGHMNHSKFLFLTISDRSKALAWLKTIVPIVSHGGRRVKGSVKPHWSLNLGFTSAGFEELGFTPDDIKTFPREFQQGMAHGERPRVLGDTGESDPTTWQFGGPNHLPVHVLIMLYGITLPNLTNLVSDVWLKSAEGSGLTLAYEQASERHGPFEAFGFRDGISQPAIEGVGEPLPGQDVLKAGEFVLGYVNEYGVMPPIPTVAAQLDVANGLKSVNGGKKDFGSNGSYFVFRKLAQNVESFWKYSEEQTLNADGSVNEAEKQLLAAKMVGRWKSGAPLAVAQTADDPDLGADKNRNNVFMFCPGDSQAFGCPAGSHVRRVNPRDTLPPNTHKSVQVSNRHRIIRRGRPYHDTEGSQEEIGLLFMAVNADIQRQFEFIQQTWCTNGHFNGLVDHKDPIIGDNDTPGNMVVPSEPFRKRYHGVPRFVDMRGGDYFFLPSIKALDFLANLS